MLCYSKSINENYLITSVTYLRGKTSNLCVIALVLQAIFICRWVVVVAMGEGVEKYILSG